jgi:UDP-3-O-[3-hydroxymyristoyl] glucosamine N-acyltransferase
MTMKNNHSVLSIEDIVSKIKQDYKIIGLENFVRIDSFKSTFEADISSLTFIDKKRLDKKTMLEKTKAKVIVVDSFVEALTENINGKCLIVVDNPKLEFSNVVNSYTKSTMEYIIHSTAVIHPNAKIHPKVYIGPNSYIGDCTIDEHTCIYGNTYIYDNVKIGKNVIVHAGCIIGVEGFGFLENSDGSLVNFPHIGGVIIEDNVELQALTHVSRGALGNTIIGKGTKTDSCVHIAHNNVIGENNMICAHAMFSGSVKMGNGNFVGPSTAIKDVLSIGNNNIIGIASTLTKNVENNLIVAGNPAREINELKKLQKALQLLINNIEAK